MRKKVHPEKPDVERGEPLVKLAPYADERNTNPRDIDIGICM